MSTHPSNDERTSALLRANGETDRALFHASEACRLLVQEFKPEQAREHLRTALACLDIALVEFGKVETSDNLTDHG